MAQKTVFYSFLIVLLTQFTECYSQNLIFEDPFFKSSSTYGDSITMTAAAGVRYYSVSPDDFQSSNFKIPELNIAAKKIDFDSQILPSKNLHLTLSGASSSDVFPSFNQNQHSVNAFFFALSGHSVWSIKYSILELGFPGTQEYWGPNDSGGVELKTRTQIFRSQDHRISGEIQVGSPVFHTYYGIHYAKAIYQGYDIGKRVSDKTEYNAKKTFQGMGVYTGLFLGKDIYFAMEADADVASRLVCFALESGINWFFWKHSFLRLNCEYFTSSSYTGDINSFRYAQRKSGLFYETGLGIAF